MSRSLVFFIPDEPTEDIQAAFRELECPEGPQQQVEAVDKVLLYNSFVSRTTVQKKNISSCGFSPDIVN